MSHIIALALSSRATEYYLLSINLLLNDNNYINTKLEVTRSHQNSMSIVRCSFCTDIDYLEFPTQQPTTKGCNHEQFKSQPTLAVQSPTAHHPLCTLHFLLDFFAIGSAMAQPSNIAKSISTNKGDFFTYKTVFTKESCDTVCQHEFG